MAGHTQIMLLRESLSEVEIDVNDHEIINTNHDESVKRGILGTNYKDKTQQLPLRTRIR